MRYASRYVRECLLSVQSLGCKIPIYSCSASQPECTQIALFVAIFSPAREQSTKIRFNQWEKNSHKINTSKLLWFNFGTASAMFLGRGEKFMERKKKFGIQLCVRNIIRENYFLVFFALQTTQSWEEKKKRKTKYEEVACHSLIDLLYICNINMRFPYICFSLGVCVCVYNSVLFRLFRINLHKIKLGFFFTLRFFSLFSVRRVKVTLCAERTIIQFHKFFEKLAYTHTRQQFQKVRATSSKHLVEDVDRLKTSTMKNQIVNNLKSFSLSLCVCVGVCSHSGISTNHPSTTHPHTKCYVSWEYRAARVCDVVLCPFPRW